MKHYIRVTSGPYAGAFYEFRTKKDALAMARALEKARPYSTDYGNDRDRFPETHLKSRRTSAPPSRHHSTMKTDRLHEAQLYWDAQDPKNEGWWLRYRDAHGVEQGTTIEANENATTEELAVAVEAKSHWLPGNGKIKVFRGGQPRGSITLTDGKISDWRAH